MSTITASLERSLQKCSLNQTAGAGDGGRSKPCNSSDYRLSNDNHETVILTASNASSSNSSATYVDLNSHISLPYHWEQCLDLKTGELYYINWSNMLRVKEDPRTTSTAGYNGDYDSDEDDEEDDEDEDEEEDNVGYESEGSSTESYGVKKLVMGGIKRKTSDEELREESILVVAGCKSCLMYHMVPKQLDICPKCCGQLLHFPPNPTKIA